LSAYAGLWHKDFLGWPSVSAAPVHKNHITDWITSQTTKGLAFKMVEFKPAAIQVTEDVAVACYRITFKWTKMAMERRIPSVSRIPGARPETIGALEAECPCQSPTLRPSNITIGRS